MKQTPKGKINVAENINPNNHRVQENQQQIHNPSQSLRAAEIGVILRFATSLWEMALLCKRRLSLAGSKPRLNPVLEKDT